MKNTIRVTMQNLILLIYTRTREPSTVDTTSGPYRGLHDDIFLLSTTTNSLHLRLFGSFLKSGNFINILRSRPFLLQLTCLLLILMKGINLLIICTIASVNFIF